MMTPLVAQVIAGRSGPSLGILIAGENKAEGRENVWQADFLMLE